MSAKTSAPVLIVGGSGIVGSQAAKVLRRLHPSLPITIGGRDLTKANAVASEIGNADAVRVDLDRADLGQSEGRAYSAVVLFVKDDALNSVRYAQVLGAAYLEISTAVFEIGPAVGLFIHQPTAAPIFLGCSWLIGSAILPALHYAREFSSVDAIEIAALLDEKDVGGPAAYADFERQTKAVTTSLIIKDGRWVWVGGDAAKRTFRAVDGRELSSQAYPSLDVLSLGAATDARSVRFDLAVGESSNRRRGLPFSTEIIIEIAGTRRDGTKARVRHEIVHPEGQAPMTAIAVAASVERLLGLDGGAPVKPGLYLPQVLLEPEVLIRRLAEFGTQFKRA
ncbi:hypothetical protein WMF30_56640 [Sorangium sp. So ce134]